MEKKDQIMTMKLAVHYIENVFLQKRNVLPGDIKVFRSCGLKGDLIHVKIISRMQGKEVRSTRSR